MTAQDFASYGAIIVSVVVAVLHGRKALQVQRLQSTTDGAALALNFARDVDNRLRALEEFYTEAGEWWDIHADEDRTRDRELMRLDPTFTPPPSKPFPRLRRQAPTAPPIEKKG